MTESTRHLKNFERLRELNPLFRTKVLAVLSDLEGKGQRPYIATGYRSVAEQARKKAGGFSHVSFGLHNCSTPAGQPDSLAVDIVDADLLWDAPTSFWLELASAGEAHGLESGALWGLSNAARAKIRTLIHAKMWRVAIALGWDVAHLQWKGISPAQAKAGVRPKATPSPKATVSPKV